MYRESSPFLQKRIEELEKELSHLRSLIPQKDVKDNLIQTLSFDNGEDAVSVIAKDFTLIEVNNQRLKGSELKRSEVIGKKCYSVFYGLNQACNECTVQEVIGTGKPSHFLKSETKGNKLRFEEKYLSPIFNKAGEIERIIIRSKDISSYYHLVNNIGEREEFYKNIFESAGDAFLVHDDQQKLLEYSPRLVQILGYTEKEFETLKVNDLYDSTPSANFVNGSDQISQNAVGIFETNMLTKKGELLPVEINTNSISFSDSEIYFVGIRNTKKRKIAEQKLRESEERFRSLVENAPDLIMRFDKNYRHLFVNSASRSILNIEPQEFIGKTHSEMGFPKEICRFWEEQMDLVFETKNLYCTDFKLEIDNKIHDFNWRLIPEMNSKGECETILGVARDITENKRNEEALNEAVKTKDKFFSIIAHDLKNPFNGLLAISKNLYLQAHEMSKEQIAIASKLIYSSATQEYNLLNNLLEWGRSQMGKIVCKPRRVELHSIIEYNIQLHKAEASKKNIETVVEGNLTAKAYVDEYMLDTVIRNLYSNAIKFTKQGGLVTIKMETNSKSVFIHIEDNGIGISKYNQNKLFRIDTNYTRLGTFEESGTGLGLIICKEFIEQNGGTVSVESIPEKGSKFSVELPSI